jgi:peptidoglycan/xylan/chitin deacetylase (PgdA/CDA1 family)
VGGKYSKKFSLRIDVDTSQGMKIGLPKILNLLRTLSIRANVYVVMGPDRNFRAMRTRLGLPRALYGLSKGLPKLVARSNPEVARRLLDEKHFVAPHGWDHQRYSMMSLTPAQKKEEFDNAVAEFERIFQFRPLSYVFPCDLVDDEGLRLVKEFGMKYLSYNSHSFEELDPSIKDGLFCLPVFPFYDGDMILRGDSHEKVQRLYVSYIDLCTRLDCVCSIAIHPCLGGFGSDEGTVAVLESVLNEVLRRGYSALTIDQLADL